MASKKVPLSTVALERARMLRQESSKAEQVLWSRLRDRSLLGLKFRRQQVLAGFILDFYCHAAKLAVEVDGGQHDEPDGRLHDVRRDAVLRGLGVHVLRFWNNEVLTNLAGVLETIRQWLDRRDPPSPGAGAHGRSAPTSLGEEG
jgi:very-short-patch-repair endonuclease